MSVMPIASKIPQARTNRRAAANDFNKPAAEDLVDTLEKFAPAVNAYFS